MLMRFTVRIFLLLFVLLIDGTCVTGVGGNQAASIQDVHTERTDPDSFVIFFSLRDNASAVVTSEGKATIEIIQMPYLSNKGRPTMLFNQTREVAKSDFKVSSLGIHYYSFGPISNSQFSHLDAMGANYAVVNIYFETSDGRVLSGKCDLPIPL